MKSYRYFIAPLIFLLIGFSSPIQSAKSIAFISVGLFLTLLYSIFFYGTKGQMNRKPSSNFSLTTKLYSILILSAATIYGIGIWLITPPTDPAWIKTSFLGLGLVVQLAFLLYFIQKKVKEKPDERFFNNLMKSSLASLITLSIILVLLSMAIGLHWFSVSLSSGLIFILLGGLLSVFTTFFFAFEMRG